MSMQITRSVWLHGTEVCQIEQLAEASGLSIEEIEDLIESDVLVPTDPKTQPRTFQLRYIVTARTARRLRDDFQLDRHGIALAMTLMRRINALESELDEVKAMLGRVT
jgi:chaperone modulatory protein CbpM